METKQNSSKPFVRLWWFVLRSSAKLLARVKAHESIWFLLSNLLPLLIVTRHRPVLLSRYMALGDIICTFPAALQLKKRHPRAAFIYHCREDYACLPRLGGVTSQIISHLNVPRLKRRYAFCFSGIYEFVYGDERENDVSRESAAADFCRQHGLAIHDTHVPLRIAPETTAKVRPFLVEAGVEAGRPLVVIHPGPCWPVREWPGESWARLVQELTRYWPGQVVQVGRVKPGETNVKIPGVISLVNRLMLEEAAAVISLCDLFVGIDSGPLHIAVSVGKPAVGLFGPTSPRFRFPPEMAKKQLLSPAACQGCHHRLPRLHWESNCPYDILCMKKIQVEDVLQACLSKLKPSPAAVH
jgi:ADP-heptose:LPS heptosyltransferase